MPYTADPTNENQPTEDVSLETAAAEFRALKRYIRQDLLEFVTDQQAAALAAAEQALAAYDQALALTGYAGNWSALTGAATPPMSVTHAGGLWYLTAPLADITTATPGVHASWSPIATNSSQISHDAGTVESALDAGVAALAAYKASGRHTEHINKVLNPLFLLVNRGTSFTGITAESRKIMDCWVVSMGAGTAAVTADRSASAPGNYPYSVRVLVTTPKASLAAGEFALVGTRLEGYDLKDMVGKPIAIGVWVYSSVIGTYHLSLRNAGNDRCYTTPFQITAASTWEYKTFVLPAGLVSAGTWDWGSGIGLQVAVCLGAGSTLTAPAVDVWQNSNYIAGAGQVNFLATNGAVFHMTALQLVQEPEVGPFPQRALVQEMRLVYRQIRPSPTAIGYTISTTILASCAMNYDPPMRAAPTATLLQGTATITDMGVASRNFSAVASQAHTTVFGNVDLTIAASTNNKVHSVQAGALLLDASL